MNYYFDQNLEPRRNNLGTIFTIKMDDSEINESKTNEIKENNRYNNSSIDKNNNIEILIKKKQNSLLNTGETKQIIKNIDINEKSDNKSIILQNEN